jgi:NOL1/NOP2/fmu family ribosome biogenesis protein
MENARKDWVDVDKCCAQPGNLRIESKEADRLLEEVGRAVRLWPGKVRGEGHFLCVLHRDGELIHDSAGSFVPGGRPVPARKEIAGAFISFAKDNLQVYTDVDPGNILSFGDQIYLVPAGMPSPNGLKVLRPGLHLGTVKKDRFEPSHALALSLGRDEAVLTADFASDSDEIRQFLNGQTLRPGGEMAQELLGKKGWCLITCDGYSIGWAKLAGGMLKNHYPKGLRINY